MQDEDIINENNDDDSDLDTTGFTDSDNDIDDDIDTDSDNENRPSSALIPLSMLTGLANSARRFFPERMPQLPMFVTEIISPEPYKYKLTIERKRDEGEDAPSLRADIECLTAPAINKIEGNNRHTLLAKLNKYHIKKVKLDNYPDLTTQTELSNIFEQISLKRLELPFPPYHVEYLQVREHMLQMILNLKSLEIVDIVGVQDYEIVLLMEQLLKSNTLKKIIVICQDALMHFNGYQGTIFGNKIHFTFSDETMELSKKT